MEIAIDENELIERKCKDRVKEAVKEERITNQGPLRNEIAFVKDEEDVFVGCILSDVLLNMACPSAIRVA